MERCILDAALKHFDREDIEHAIRNAIVHKEDDRSGETRTWIIGPRRDGLAIGVAINADGCVFHAYWPEPDHLIPKRRP